MTPWHYDAATETVCDADTGDAIARDANREHGALIAAAPDMREALAEFVRRVDAGEIKSRKTYSAFKAILARTEPQP